MCVYYIYIYIPKINFEKLVHLVAFIIGMYHDARSSECLSNMCVENCMRFINID